MAKGSNRDISSRHKRLAQKETENDYLLLESSSSGETYFGPSLAESIKECQIENENNQSSVSTSPSLDNDQEHINQYSPNFSSNNDKQEFSSDEVHNSSEVYSNTNALYH